MAGFFSSFKKLFSKPGNQQGGMSMPGPTIVINGGMPDVSTVRVDAGKQIVFRSGDGQSYSVDFTTDNDAVSSQLPLTIPASGTARLDVSGSAPKQSFQYVIRDSDGEQVWPMIDEGPGNVPPEVIVGP